MTLTYGFFSVDCDPCAGKERGSWELSISVLDLILGLSCGIAPSDQQTCHIDRQLQTSEAAFICVRIIWLAMAMCSGGSWVQFCLELSVHWV